MRLASQTQENSGHHEAPPAKRCRVSQACAKCRSQKLKCDGNQPCNRCIRLRVMCRPANTRSSHHRDLADLYEVGGESRDQHEQDSLQQALIRIAKLERGMVEIQSQMIRPYISSDLSALQLASQQPKTAFPALFTEVAFDKSSLENRQVTRANSPAAEGDGVEVQEVRMNTVSAQPHLVQGFSALPNPIESRVVDEERGQYLLDFYMTHCYSYLPFFQDDAVIQLRQLQESDPFLTYTMLAVASRFTKSYSVSSMNASERESEALCQLTEAHLGATLVRNRHRLGDVQAVIILHAWSLRSGGKGSDPWILSGHAFRLAKRLSIDRMNVLGGIEGEHQAARRTWLVLCASDCFPSLGFGRPASPRENLESCSNIVKKLLDLFLIDRVDIGCEAFIASQVQLASISRQLLDWVAQESSQASQTTPVREKYRTLKQQIDQCDRDWDTSRLWTSTQRRSARLFRLHVRLCLATFALRLSESTTTTTSEWASSPHSIGSNRSAGDSSRGRDGHRTYRKACLDAVYDMIMVHKEEPCLAYLPDYLVTALAQAAITFVGLVEDEVEEAGNSNSSHHYSRAGPLIQSTLQVLSRFEGSRAALATFLAGKIRERVERSLVLLPTLHPVLKNNSDSQAVASTEGVHRDHTMQQQEPGRRRPQSAGQSSITEQFTGTNDQHAISQWADPDFSHWWDNDDPLRLLFGSGADELAWTASMGT